MPGRLDRPGVDVFQILESRKPTALRPVLVPVIVGAHKNIQYNLPLVFHNTQLKATATIGIHADNTAETPATIGDTVEVVDNTAAGAITSTYIYAAASSVLDVAIGSNMVDSLTNLATQINLGTASSNIRAVYDVNSKVVTLTQGVFGTTGNGLAVDIVTTDNAMTASTTFAGGRNPETSDVAIPTGLSAVVQQKFSAKTDISVYMETTRGLALLTEGASEDYTVSLDGSLGVNNNIATSGTIDVTKNLVNDAIADTVVLSSESSTNYIIIQDSSMDFSAAGVQAGDIITIDFATSALNSTITESLVVSSVESSSKLKAAFIDNNATWQNDILVTYDINTPEMTALSGQIYVSYSNALVINDTNKLIEINGAQDIKDNFGELTPENPLGYHCLMGALATDRTFYATRVNEDSITGFELGFDSLKTVDDAYYVIPASQDDNIQALAKTHAEFMSDPYQKGERVSVISKVIPDYDIIDNNTVSGGFVTTTLASTTAASSILTAVGSLNTIAPGHIVRVEETGLQLADGSYVNNETTKLVVLAVSGQNITVSGNIAKLNGTDLSTDDAVSACRITSTSYVGGDKARVAAEKASAIDSKRVTNIFPDTMKASVTRKTQEAPNYDVVTSTLVEDVPGSVAAACIGCHASALKPVQPQTNIVVPGISGAVGSNDELTADNLDVVAGGGNWILLNQRGGNSVITRHQLTTAVSDVNTREFSVVKSVDYASKVFRNYLSPLVGKSIITDSFIKKVVTPTAFAAMHALTDSGQISIKSKVLAIYQNVSDPTRITVEVDILPLYPANYFTVKLFI
jgi:hypothetical protein